MTLFKATKEYEKERKKLAKRFYSLDADIEELKLSLRGNPVQTGKKTALLRGLDNSPVRVFKRRLACQALRDNSLRIIYAYSAEKDEVAFIELYYKGDKENENRGRIERYLAELKNSVIM